MKVYAKLTCIKQFSYLNYQFLIFIQFFPKLFLGYHFFIIVSKKKPFQYEIRHGNWSNFWAITLKLNHSHYEKN